MLQLPLWTVTEHVEISESASDPDIVLGTALAFSTSSKLYQFLSANQAGKWKMEMAGDRDGLVILIADLHRAGVETIHLDPDTDGNGGEQLPLADVVAFANSLR